MKTININGIEFTTPEHGDAPLKTENTGRPIEEIIDRITAVAKAEPKPPRFKGASLSTEKVFADNSTEGHGRNMLDIDELFEKYDKMRFGEFFEEEFDRISANKCANLCGINSSYLRKMKSGERRPTREYTYAVCLFYKFEEEDARAAFEQIEGLTPLCNTHVPDAIFLDHINDKGYSVTDIGNMFAELDRWNQMVEDGFFFLPKKK